MINDLRSDIHYTDHDYIVLKYTTLWNTYDRIHKIYVTDADEDKVRQLPPITTNYHQLPPITTNYHQLP